MALNEMFTGNYMSGLFSNFAIMIRDCLHGKLPLTGSSIGANPCVCICSVFTVDGFVYTLQ